jgi:hypothetical protein
MNNNLIVTQDAPEVKAEQAEKRAMKEQRKWTQKSLKSISQSSDWTLYA